MSYRASPAQEGAEWHVQLRCRGEAGVIVPLSVSLTAPSAASRGPRGAAHTGGREAEETTLEEELGYRGRAEDEAEEANANAEWE